MYGLPFTKRDFVQKNRPGLAKAIDAADECILLQDGRLEQEQEGAEEGRIVCLLYERSRFSYRLISSEWYEGEPERVEMFELADYGMEALSQATRISKPGTDGTQENETKDDARFVMVRVPRERVGRHKRELTDEEKEQIRQWRQGGRGIAKSINEIAEMLHVRNRTVMAYLKTLSK